MRTKFKNCDIVGTSFNPCITDGLWFVSHVDVVDASLNKQSTYIFGADGTHLTFYNKNNPKFKLIDLAIDTLIKHLEKNPDDLDVGLFRFEFDGEQFNFCEKEPKWASYDYGIIEAQKEPIVQEGDIIKIGNGTFAPKAKVVTVYNKEQRETGVCGDIEVIYNQNNLKAVKEDLIWNGKEWKFKTPGPCGFVVGSLDKYPELK